MGVTWCCLGCSYSRIREYQKAERCLEESLRIEPSFEAFTILGALLVEKDPVRAKSLAASALEFNPDWEEAQRVLSVAEENLRKGKDGAD